VRRRHEPAEAQARGHRLRRGAEVGDAGAVERRERGDGCDVVAELGVVVVLDDHGVLCRRRREQRHPVGRRHHVAERVLVGGGHVGRDHVRRHDRDTAGGDVDDRASRGADGGDRRPVAGVLHRDGAVGQHLE
jgi:hypothetical protein